MKPERDPVVILSVVCILIAAAVITYSILMSPAMAPPPVRSARPTPTPSPIIPGVTVHPQGELAPMPLDAVSPPYLVDYGDGKGPQVERGKLHFGEATPTP